MDSPRLKALELQISRLIELTDESRNPAAHFFLRHNATEDQEIAVRRLLDDTWRLVKAGGKVNQFDFETGVGKIFDAQKAHILAVEIVDAYGRMGDFKPAIAALKATGWF